MPEQQFHFDTAAPEPPAREVYSVSRLNREARALLERGLPALWIEGEISNLARPASGHLYFTLKDDRAQVRCAMFRSRNAALGFALADGMQVLARARVSLYEPRGEFQLVVEHLEPAGEGALRLAFEALKRRLAAEGLFAAERKRSLPRFPRCVGVVTSPSGAALRDVLSVLGRRFPAVPVILYPVPVQGAGAARLIAAMIERASARAECDVLLLVRGGGSLEDLWAFNEEPVARAIAACRIPVVTGIGHEIDFSIADFAADVRAPTPSAAAELVSADAAELGQRCTALLGRLERRMRERLGGLRQRLEAVRRRLVHPGRRLDQLAQRLDELHARLPRALKVLIEHRRARLAELRAHLRRTSPLYAIAAYRQRVAADRRHLAGSARAAVERARARLQGLVRALEAVSPLATLGRGFALVQRADDGRIVRAAAEVRPGERITARLARGRLEARVERSDADREPDQPVP